MTYVIRVKGRLSPDRAEWFDGFRISTEKSGDTLLTGAVEDQAALYGILKKIRDSAIPLISVNPVRKFSSDML